MQYFSFHEIFSLTLNARINPHCWRFCFGIRWGSKFPKLTFVLPKLILKYKIVNFALEAKPVKGTTTSCVEIAPYYNVLFCGFFVMFWLLRKEFALNWTCPGGISRHKVQFWGSFGWGVVGLGGGCPTPPLWRLIDYLAVCLVHSLQRDFFNLPSQEFGFRRSL